MIHQFETFNGIILSIRFARARGAPDRGEAETETERDETATSLLLLRKLRELIVEWLDCCKSNWIILAYIKVMAFNVTPVILYFLCYSLLNCSQPESLVRRSVNSI